MDLETKPMTQSSQAIVVSIRQTLEKPLGIALLCATVHSPVSHKSMLRVAKVATMLGALIALSTAALAAQEPSRNPAPVVPIVERDLCPGEGCEFGEWLACQSFAAHASEDARSPVVFRLKRSMPFRALTGNVHVERAGLIVFRDTVRITDEEILGHSTLVFTPSDTLYPLFYGGEGFGTWYFHGKKDGGPWIVPDEHTSYETRRGVVQVRRAVVHWWIHARNAAGLEGWIDFGPLDYPPHAQAAGMAPHYEDAPFRCE